MSYYRKDIVRPVIISVDISDTFKICSNLINNTIYKLKYPFSSMNFSKSMKIKKNFGFGFSYGDLYRSYFLDSHANINIHII